ncbi:LytTR family DNA-binding domain-containing protein [uncultured Lactobacillus sp.]|uniref:LytTR family DNA-binding domain-containing protein n=1 Tax=uncultured Lactobacillus sp. TaxID=153152 RepID=UPI002616155B|nr:LytTR family DNA-binding domain-containing protein [uncultured Lactobacillus sp.]
MEIKFNIDENFEKEKVEFWIRRMTDKVKRAARDLQVEQNFIWGYQENEAYRVEYRQIYSIQVENEKTYICTKDSNYQFKGRLYQVKTNLPSDFIEASRSAIINYHFIDHLEIIRNGNIDAVMKNGLRVQIARRKIKNLKERLGL